MTETYDKINHWYGWNNPDNDSGMCPVHPKTQVIVAVSGGNDGPYSADEWGWSSEIVAFKITKLHEEPKQPKEWFIATDRVVGRPYAAYETIEDFRKAHGYNNYVRVLEVIEETDNETPH